MRRSAGEIAAFLDDRARAMRKFPTPAEALLWDALAPLGFKRQHPINGETKNQGGWRYILDFVWLVPYYRENFLALCVEVDGSAHRRTKGRDRRRDTRLATIGIRTIRVSNADVLRHLDKVMDVIHRAMAGLPDEPRPTKWDNVENTEF
jgi:very-short-patch-repair endonuclease